MRGILVSDRAKALNFWAMERRQVCWSHLLQRFVSFSERGGPAAELGRQLLDYAGIHFEYWHDYKAGKPSREGLRAWMAPSRVQVEALLQRAVATNIKGVSGSCADILAPKEALWTFVEQEGVEPTNNHAYAARGMAMPRRGLCRIASDGAGDSAHLSAAVRSPMRHSYSDVFLAQPLDALGQSLIARRVHHAARIARVDPTLNPTPTACAGSPKPTSAARAWSCTRRVWSVVRLLALIDGN